MGRFWSQFERNASLCTDICRRDENCEQRSEENSTEELALEVITYVGVALSLIGIVATIITLLVFQRLRKRDATKFHVQLCVAIGCMLIVFVVGVDRSEVFGICVTMSALIQYFTLASVMWMGAEALLMFQKLVIVFIQFTTRYFVIVSLVCWLAPLVPVVIPLAIDPDYMVTFESDGGTVDFCFIGEVGVFWGAFLGPIFAILLFNTVVFVIVVIILVRHTRSAHGRMKEQQNQQKTTIRLLVSIIGIMSLFGLSWFFAALTVREASTAFQFLFTIFNSLQGFFIFLFFCVLSKDARELWKEVFSCGHYHPSFYPSKPYVSSSSATPRYKARATKSTSLTGTGTSAQSSTMTTELTSSGAHASAGAAGYDIHLLGVSHAGDEEQPYNSGMPPLSGEYSSHLPTVQETEITGIDDDSIFTNPVATELTESLVEETDRALDIRRRREATRYAGRHERETVEVDLGMDDDGEEGGLDDGGGERRPVEVDLDLEEDTDGYSGRIRGVVV